MTYGSLNIGSYSGAGSSKGPLDCTWISLTLEEQLKNFQRIIQFQHSNIYFDAIFFKSIARAMKELRIDPCVDIQSVLPLLEDLEYVGGHEHVGTLEHLLHRSTPLHWAVLMGDRKMVHYILTLGKVDINASTKYWGETALHYAIIGGNHSIVEDLLEHKVDVWICNSSGKSAIYYMVLQKDSMFGILKTILANNVCDETKDTPLHHAIREENTNVVTYLLHEKANVNLHNQFGYTPLHYTAREGAMNIVSLLVEQNADVDALTNDGICLLHIAVTGEHFDIVTHLVEHNANVNALDKDGLCLLHIAAIGGHLHIVKHLVEHNANINALDKDGLSPLHIAAERGHLDIVTHLMEHNADVNTLNKDEVCPLHIAAVEGHLHIVTHLVEHNANVNALDKDGRSPLYIAAKRGYLDIVIHLVEHNADVNTSNKDKVCPLHIAAREGHVRIVTHLVEHNANINTSNKFGWTPLFYSIKNRRVYTSNELIAIGVDVHVKDKWNNNALHLSIQAYDRNPNMMNIVKLLRECNVDSNAKNSKGYSPFFVAMVEGHTEVVKELLQSKKKIKLMEECNGQIAIQIAFDYGYEHIKRALLQCDDVSRYVAALYRDCQVYVDSANAILVGAALIASVTFASWLQPPLGYTTPYLDLDPSSSNINYVDVQHNVSLRAFWVFNTLSFYFAIGTVVFGARSVLPRRQMFIKDIVVKLHQNLLVTSILLACSVFFVIIAFGIVECIVLTPTLKFQWYMIVPTIFGRLVCLVNLGFLFKSMVEDNLEKKRKKFHLY